MDSMSGDEYAAAEAHQALFAAGDLNKRVRRLEDLVESLVRFVVDDDDSGLDDLRKLVAEEVAERRRLAEERYHRDQQIIESYMTD